MNRTTAIRWGVSAVTLAFTLMVSGAVYAQHKPPAGKAAHAFKGKVEKVDASAKELIVNGEDVPGWMTSMIMVYQVDNQNMLKVVKAGDQITAMVYDGDYAMLYNVKVISPAKK